MRIHVLGIGSIGTLISHNLRQRHPTLPISLIVRSAKKFPSTDRTGLTAPSPILSVIAGDQKSRSEGYDLEKWPSQEIPREAEASADVNPPKNGPIQSLVVCLKTWATVPALTRLRPRLSPSSVVVLLQNGMGVYDELCETLYPDPENRPFFILGTTTHAALPGPAMGSVEYRSKPGEGRLNFGLAPDPRKEVNLEQWLWGYSAAASEPILAPPAFPPLPIPPPPPSSTDLSNLHETLNVLLSMGNLHPSLLPMPHLRHQLMLKVALNSIINPLTAILGLGHLPNSCLLSGESSFRLVRWLAAETSSIITAYLKQLSGSAYTAPDVISTFSRESLERRVRRLCHSTADNISSMAMDVAKGRLTEIDEINGYIVSLGKKVGIDAPRNRMVVEMVKWHVQQHHQTQAAGRRAVAREEKRKVPLTAYLQSLNLIQKQEGGGITAEARDLAHQAMSLEEKRLKIEERRLRIDEEKIAAKKETRHLRHKVMREEVLRKFRAREEKKAGQAAAQELTTSHDVTPTDEPSGSQDEGVSEAEEDIPRQGRASA